MKFRSYTDNREILNQQMHGVTEHTHIQQFTQLDKQLQMYNISTRLIIRGVIYSLTFRRGILSKHIA